jgi:hypothetical protein
MQTLFSDGEHPAARAGQPIEVDFHGRPMLGVLYALSGIAIDLFGPIFWAMLIVLLVQAELFGR